jgi:hypothetical protein
MAALSTETKRPRAKAGRSHPYGAGTAMSECPLEAIVGFEPRLRLIAPDRQSQRSPGRRSPLAFATRLPSKRQPAQSIMLIVPLGRFL